MTRIKTIFLDRDGIINDVVVRDSGISSPRSLAEFRITDDFPQLYSRIRNFDLFVVSNQPDVSRNQLDKEVLNKFNELLLERFDFREIIYCTHDDADNCPCRKPKPGMILSTLDQYNLSANEAIIIGDSYKDILAGQSAGIRTIYCQRSYNATISCEPNHIVRGLEEVLTLSYFSALP